ncbi:MAG TPA: SpoIIE family protein phosphatase [Thermoclostridium sp.]|nr:SpoIIE family protein phosphatase [Thermoclostridium sp.]
MKGTSVYTPKVTMTDKKSSPLYARLKSLTLSQILMSAFSGIISQGTLVGVIKPFGPAFYAAYSGSTTVKMLMVFFIFLWNTIRGDVLSALKQTAIILLYEWLKKIFLHDENKIVPFKNALFLVIATGITGIFVFIINQQILESILIISMEVILSCILVIVFSKTIYGDNKSLESFSEYKYIEYLGMLIIGCACILGLSGVNIAWLHIERVVASLGLIMLARSLGPGFGACAGCMVGMALSGGLPDSFLPLAGMYAVTGMAVGMISNSKIASGSIFFIIQFLFILLSENIPIILLEVIVATVLFLIIPNLKTGTIVKLKQRMDITNCHSENISRIRHVVSGKICGMSKALYKLGHTLEHQLNDDQPSSEEVCNATIEHLTQRVCKSCNKADKCWDERLFYTYSNMCKLVGELQEKGANSINESERELSRFCVKPGLVVDTLLRVIEIKRVDSAWQRIILESQALIPEQIYAISEILTKLSDEIISDVEFFSDEEKNIDISLKKSDYPVIKTEVKRGVSGKFSVMVQFDGCKGQKLCSKAIENIVSKALGVNMLMVDDDCRNKGRDLCTLYLKEKENLGVLTGVSRLKKDKANVSGDSFSFLRTCEGKYIVAISDGMGSGKEANKLSEVAVGLFEQLLDCGVSIGLALNLVNVLLSVESLEKYATMDIAAIDLYTGETEFYKMGAMPSFIVSGKHFDYVQINNLPAGLHKGDFIQCERKKLTDGEFIIMMTDGVYDRLNEGLDNKIIERVLNTKNTLNPQEMAENLLEKACGQSEIIYDDMTVLVAKVWRKTG